MGRLYPQITQIFTEKGPEEVYPQITPMNADNISYARDVYARMRSICENLCNLWRKLFPVLRTSA
jgi:hypothetical protein